MTPLEGAALRRVLIPTEHGGWSLTLEPVLFGLLAAPSVAGVAIGVAALIAFVVRTPLKLVLVDRRRRRWLDRTTLAARAVAVEGVVLLALGVGAVVVAEHAFWWPVIAAVPMVTAALAYDMRSRSRRLAPELVGSIGVAAAAPVIALAGGLDDGVAIGMWLVAAARAVGAIPFVRVQLRRGKAQQHRLVASDGAQVLSVLVAVGGWITGVVPIAAVVAIAVAAGAMAVLVRVPVPSVAIIGAQQVVIGLSIVLAAGLGVRAGV